MIQIQIRQRKRHTQHSLGMFQTQTFRRPLSRSNDPLICEKWCLTVCIDYYQPEKITWALVSRVSLELLSLRITDWFNECPQSNSISRSTDTMWLKALTLNLMIGLLLWTACTLSKDTPISYGRDHLPGAFWYLLIKNKLVTNLKYS